MSSQTTHEELIALAKSLNHEIRMLVESADAVRHLLYEAARRAKALNKLQRTAAYPQKGRITVFHEKNGGSTVIADEVG